jgi:hypothetical protein
MTPADGLGSRPAASSVRTLLSPAGVYSQPDFRECMPNAFAGIGTIPSSSSSLSSAARFTRTATAALTTATVRHLGAGWRRARRSHLRVTGPPVFYVCAFSSVVAVKLGRNDVVIRPDQAVWALRITARDRYSDRCWCWGEPLGIAMECAVDGLESRWNGVMAPERSCSGRGERYACVATTQRFALSIPGFELGLKSIARIQIGLPRRAEDRPDRDRPALRLRNSKYLDNEVLR